MIEGPMKHPPKLKVKERREPKLGEIIAVPLGDNRWAYLCSTGGIRYLPLNFISHRLIKHSPEFSRSNWLRPIKWDGGMPVTYLTVGQLELDPNEGLAGMWRILEHNSTLLDAPAGSYIYRDTRSWRQITPEEAAVLPRQFRLDHSLIADYMLAQNLRVLEGSFDAPPLKKMDMVPESVDLQVTLQCDGSSYLAEELSTEFEKALNADVVTGWELIDGDDSEVVIRAEKASASEVTNIMRRVMRKQLTPDQLESVDFERIEDGKDPRELVVIPKPRTPRTS